MRSSRKRPRNSSRTKLGPDHSLSRAASATSRASFSEARPLACCDMRYSPKGVHGARLVERRSSQSLHVGTPTRGAKRQGKEQTQSTAPFLLPNYAYSAPEEDQRTAGARRPSRRLAPQPLPV